jgi:hypothetical protein
VRSWTGTEIVPSTDALLKGGHMHNKDSMSHRLGDSIERVGQKISDKGAPRVGEAVRKVGDKVEHLSEKKPLTEDKDRTW